MPPTSTPSIIEVAGRMRSVSLPTRPWNSAIIAGLMSVMISSGAFSSMWRVTYCGNV